MTTECLSTAMQVFGRAVTPSSAVHGQVCQFLRQKQRDWVLFDLCYVLMLLKKTMEENQVMLTSSPLSHSNNFNAAGNSAHYASTSVSATQVSRN